MLARIKALGIDETISVLEHTAGRATNTLPVMDKILNDMFRIEEQIFQSGGRRGGGSWKGLQTNTLRRKTTTKILIESHTLLESVSSRSGGSHATNTEAVLETDVPYAATHQFGDPSRNIPRRTFIRFTPFDLRRWRIWITEHILRG